MRYVSLLFAVGLLCVTQISAAAAVSVSWTADVTPVNTRAVNPGSGTLSGSLGTFDVSTPGQTFDIPRDSALTVVASGFASGFPNGPYPLTRGTTRVLQLEFLTIGTSPADFSVNFIDNNAGALSPYSNPCTVGGTETSCFVSLFDESGTGHDIAVVSLGIDGSLDDSSIGRITYHFEVGR
jgi:hypothetical protein